MNSKSTSISVFIALSQMERDEAKALAKSKGMTFQGWLGNLVKKELEAQNADRR